MTVPKPPLSDNPTEGELLARGEWLKKKLAWMVPQVASWRNQRADVLRMLHDDHGHSLRDLGTMFDLKAPTILDAIERSRKRAGTDAP